MFDVPRVWWRSYIIFYDSHSLKSSANCANYLNSPEIHTQSDWWFISMEIQRCRTPWNWTFRETRINKSDKYAHLTHTCIYVSCPAYLINIFILDHSWWIRLGGGHSTLCFKGSEFFEPVHWIHHVFLVSNRGRRLGGPCIIYFIYD